MINNYVSLSCLQDDYNFVYPFKVLLNFVGKKKIPLLNALTCLFTTPLAGDLAMTMPYVSVHVCVYHCFYVYLILLACFHND